MEQIEIEATKSEAHLLIELGKWAFVAEQTAIKSAILINGGGAVALLAFIGCVWTDTNSDATVNSNIGESLLFAMAFYVGGTLISAAATAFNCFSLSHEITLEEDKKAFPLWAIAWVLVFGGYAGFAWASWLAFSAIRLHFTCCC